MPQLNIILGAGFSVDAGLPLVNDFNRYFNRDITGKLCMHSSSEWFWRELANEIDIHNASSSSDCVVYSFVLQEVLKSYGQLLNYEDFYEYLTKLGSEGYKEYFDRAKENYLTLCSLTRDHDAIRLFEAYQVNMILEIFNYLILDLLKIRTTTDALVASYSTFLKFIQSYDTVRIFSLNHDLLLETLFQNSGVPFSDGFTKENSVIVGDKIIEGVGDPQPTYQNYFKDDIHLVKLHGSDRLFRYAVGNEQGGVVYPNGEAIYFKTDSYNDKHHASRVNPETGKVVQGFIDDIVPKFITGHSKLEIIQGDMMYSSLYAKFEEDFNNTADLLVVGYSYCDAHINSVIKKSQTIEKVININPRMDYLYSNHKEVINLNSLEQLENF